MWSLFLLTLVSTQYAVEAVPLTPAAPTPQTIAITARKVTSNNRLSRRALKSYNLPLQDFYLGTDLQ